MHGGDLGTMEGPTWADSASETMSVTVGVSCAGGMHEQTNE